MARGYRPVDRDQEFLLPPSMIDWLPGDHLVWFVIAAVQRLDTTVFHRMARVGGVGRRGYDPDMLLMLFVYAMAHGESSSRQIERLCHTDVAFRVICAQDVPDHTVLARFRKNHEAALIDLLTESLVLAAELGMVSLGVVAFDGTKIAANAAMAANRDEVHLRRLAEQFVSRVADTDQAEDERFGEDNRGEGLPEPVRDRSRRAEWIDQALEQIRVRREAAARAERARAERARAYERAAGEQGNRRGPAPPGTDRVAVARARWQRERAKAATRYEQLRRARGHGRRPGRPPVPPDEHCQVRKAKAAYDAAQAEAAATPADTAATAAANDTDAASQQTASAPDPTSGAQAPGTDKQFKANLTDPASRLLKTRNGWIQGYNCQTATSGDGFIVSARATQDANDVEQFVPTLNDLTATAEHLARRTGRTDLTVGTMLGDAGYDSTDNLTADGPDRLIADAKRHTLAQRAAADPATGNPPEHASAREKMNHRLRTPDGHALYKRRAPLVEAPNAWLKDRRGLRRFTRRGLTAVQAELCLAAAVTNLLKLATNGITAARLQAGQARAEPLSR
jgi:transposase